MVTVRLSDELKHAIDCARGDVPRERWVRRVLEQALGASGAGVPPSPGPAPARAPKVGTPVEMGAGLAGPPVGPQTPPEVQARPVMPKAPPEDFGVPEKKPKREPEDYPGIAKWKR